MVLIGTLCTQLLLQVHINQFETLQASFLIKVRGLNVRPPVVLVQV